MFALTLRSYSVPPHHCTECQAPGTSLQSPVPNPTSSEEMLAEEEKVLREGDIPNNISHGYIILKVLAFIHIFSLHPQTNILEENSNTNYL